MTALYITSLSEHTGKTMLCAGLGKTWQNSGKKVGYLKLQISNTGSDKDAEFVKQVLGLKEPLEALSFSIESKGDIAGVIKQAYQKVVSGKDVVLIDGLSLNESGTIIESLNDKVLVVHDYSSPLFSALPEYEKTGKRLLGVVLNKVPRRKLAVMQSQTAADLSSVGVGFLGAIPEDRVLLGITVAELAELLQGKILNNAEKSSEVIESIMLGAMTFDSGLDYFGRKNNKAVIVKGERPDVMLAALQTSTRCLVISGGGSPIPVVAQQAAAKKVPLISAPGGVTELIMSLGKGFERMSFNQEKKIPQLVGILKQNVNLKALSVW
jgi:uncharacterized protein